MANKLIFITGATGFIGSQVVQETLKAGYHVRLSVRNVEQIQPLKDLFASSSGELEFVIVADITKVDAFEGLLNGVDYIFHLASPMPGTGVDLENDYIKPAVRGTESVLQAAKKVPTIKKVIITSSVIALMPMGSLEANDLVIKENSNVDLTVDREMEFPEGFVGHGLKYQASKILAHQSSQRFVNEYKPEFTLITLHPTFVLGKSLIQKSAQDISGINALLDASLRSEKPLFPPICVHVQDVAEAHLKLLEVPLETGEEILLSAPKFKWEDIVRLIKDEYPSVDVRLQPPFDETSTVDSSKADKLLGINWKSGEDMIREVLDQQLSFGI